MIENPSEPKIEEHASFRSGFVAVVGLPNVGKSTMINHFAQTELSIVSPKAQTTRHRILVLVNRPLAQIAFLDTPGVTEDVDALRKVMRQTTRSTLKEADVILVIVEAMNGQPRLTRRLSTLLKWVNEYNAIKIIAINKTDKIPQKEKLLPWIDFFHLKFGESEIIPVSAKENKGLDTLLNCLCKHLPFGPRLYPADMMTDQIERFLCAEIVRKQILFQIKDEVPHATTVLIDVFMDNRDVEVKAEQKVTCAGQCHIEGIIYVEKNSQKGILVGREGNRIKKISTNARLDMEKLLQCPVFLKLRVKVEKNWRNNKNVMKRMGYQ